MTAVEVLAAAWATAAFRQMSRPRATAFLLRMGDDFLAEGKSGQAVAPYRRATEAGDHGAVNHFKVVSGAQGSSARIDWSTPNNGPSGSEDALSLAQRCVNAWEEFFTKHGLNPEA